MLMIGIATGDGSRICVLKLPLLTIRKSTQRGGSPMSLKTRSSYLQFGRFPAKGDELSTNIHVKLPKMNRSCQFWAAHWQANTRFHLKFGAVNPYLFTAS
jgi:hypothetical protein